MPMSVVCTVSFCLNDIMIETRQFGRNKSIRAKKLTSVNSYVPSILRFGENLLKTWIGKHDSFCTKIILCKTCQKMTVSLLICTLKSDFEGGTWDFSRLPPWACNFSRVWSGLDFLIKGPLIQTVSNSEYYL